MILRHIWSAVLLACLVAASAQDDAPSSYKHPLTDLPPSGDITVNHFFPNHPVTKFPAGEQIKVVAGIHNDASSGYNISAIMGSINIPNEFSQYIQNFTQQLYFVMLEPGEELSVEYAFHPDRLLAGREFQLALTLFYEDTKGGFFSTTFFNQTVDFTEIEKLIDTEAIFLYLLFIAAIGAAGFWGYKSLAGVTGMKVKTKSKPKPRTDAAKESDAGDWLKGTNYDPNRKATKSTSQKKAS